MTRRALIGVALSVAGLLVAYQIVATAPARAQDRIAFAKVLWDSLQAKDYRQWAPLPRHSADMYPGKSPHGAFLKLYGNRTAVSHSRTLPYGSIIVKENFKPDKSLAAVTVMYRIKGFDPTHHDWYWVKYMPNGAVAKKGTMQAAGKVGTCIGCHAQAKGNDWTFSND